MLVRRDASGLDRLLLPDHPLERVGRDGDVGGASRSRRSRPAVGGAVSMLDRHAFRTGQEAGRSYRFVAGPSRAPRREGVLGLPGRAGRREVGPREDPDGLRDLADGAEARCRRPSRCPSPGRRRAAAGSRSRRRRRPSRVGRGRRSSRSCPSPGASPTIVSSDADEEAASRRSRCRPGARSSAPAPAAAGPPAEPAGRLGRRHGHPGRRRGHPLSVIPPAAAVVPAVPVPVALLATVGAAAAAARLAASSRGSREAPVDSNPLISRYWLIGILFRRHFRSCFWVSSSTSLPRGARATKSMSIVWSISRRISSPARSPSVKTVTVLPRERSFTVCGTLVPSTAMTFLIPQRSRFRTSERPSTTMSASAWSMFGPAGRCSGP